VDTAVRQALRSLLREVHDRTALPLLLVTHDREDVLDLADYVVVLDRGQVVQAGPTEEVFTRPANRRVAALVGIPNVVTVRSLQPSQHGQVRALTDWGDMTLPAPERSGSAWELAVPTDAVRVTAGGKSARILGVRPAVGGWRIWVRLERDGEPLEALVPRSDFTGRPFPGLSCDIALNADSCHLIPAASGGLAATMASSGPTASRWEPGHASQYPRHD
jgi:ABC-type sulfate/molybdate transport systems ATPase subunit